MKMPGMHISDIPYDAFLTNGKKEVSYSDYKAGQSTRKSDKWVLPPIFGFN